MSQKIGVSCDGGITAVGDENFGGSSHELHNMVATINCIQHVSDGDCEIEIMT